MKRLATIAAIAVAISVLGAGLAACGSSGGSSSEGGSTAESTTEGSSGSSTESANTESSSSGDEPEGIATLQKYVGSSGKAESNLSPYTIGFINQQGGAPSAPEATTAAEAAVDTLNEQLGGIEGHPVELKTCFVASSVEEGQKCAQEMVNDSDVKFVIGSSQTAAEAIHQTIAGKLPYVSYVPISPSDVTAPNSFGMNAGIFGSSPGFVAYATEFLHAKKVALLAATDDPAAVEAAKQITGSFEAAGVTVKQAGFSSNSSDLLGPLESAGATEAEAIVALVYSPPTVIAAAKAVEQLGAEVPVLGLGSALQEGVQEGLGDYPKWTYNFVALNPAVPDNEGITASYLGAMSAYQPKASPFGNAVFSFGAVISAAKAVASAGAEATPEQVVAALKKFKGPVFMGPPTLAFGSIPGLPGLGTMQSRFYTYEGENKWVDATHGEWLEAPAGK